MELDPVLLVYACSLFLGKRESLNLNILVLVLVLSFICYSSSGLTQNPT